MQSNAHIVLGFLCPSHYVVYHLVESIMLVMESRVLELQVLKFFVLLVGIAFEELSQIVHSLTNFFMQLMEFGLGTLF